MHHRMLLTLPTTMEIYYLQILFQTTLWPAKSRTVLHTTTSSPTHYDVHPSTTTQFVG